MSIKSQATIEDLYHVPENGEAEILNGELRLMSPAGDLPGRAALRVAVSLDTQSRLTGAARAYGDNVGFTVNLPNRQSFSPDAVFYVGPRTGGKFLEGAFVFAVEVRSEGDYGPAAERDMAANASRLLRRRHRRRLGGGGAQIRNHDGVSSERSQQCHHLRRGEVAEAEPALPGWSMPVDDLFLSRTS
jgi:hypothetical protein